MKEPCRFDPYLLDTLLPDLVGHDRQPSAFLVYLYLADRVTRGRTRGCAASLSAIAATRPSYREPRTNSLPSGSLNVV